MNCKSCQSENIKLLKISKWHTGYFCNDCGNGRIDYYSDGCCSNQNHTDIRFEQSNGVWVQRVVCKNCRKLIGGAKKKGQYFNSLQPYYHATYKEDQNNYSDSYQKLSDYIRTLSDEFRQNQKDKWWAWYNNYLNTDQWKELRKKVLIRENGICQGCKINKARDVHHTTYANCGDELLFQLVALCGSCHQKMHLDKTL